VDRSDVEPAQLALDLSCDPLRGHAMHLVKKEALVFSIVVGRRVLEVRLTLRKKLGRAATAQYLTAVEFAIRERLDEAVGRLSRRATMK